MPGLYGTGWARNFLVQTSPGRKPRLGLVARGHAQEVAHAHRLKVLARILGGIVREEFEHFIIDAQLPFRDGQAHGRGGEALAQRVKCVGRFRLVRRPPPFGHDVPVANQHEAMQRIDFLLGLVDEGENRGRTKRPAPRVDCAAANRRGRSAAAEIVPLQATIATMVNVFMLVIRKGKG